MSISKLALSYTAIFATSVTTAFAAVSRPILTVDFKSYQALSQDVALVSDAVGEDASMAMAQIPGMLGPEIFALLDQSQPWNVSAWMDSMIEPPVVAIVLPIADFEAFETAVTSSFIGMMGAKYFDAGDHVVIYGSKPGMPIADTWAANLASYAESLSLAPNETIELNFQLSNSIKDMLLSAIALPKAQMMAAFTDANTEEAGLPLEAMQEMMEMYFSFYETMLRDMDSLSYGLSVKDDDLNIAFSFTPVEGSKSEAFLESQNIGIADLAPTASWDSDLTFVFACGPLPEAWQPGLEKFMQTLMPVYGLEASDAAEWVKLTNESFPFRSVYNIDFDPSFKFSGFYELLGTPAAEFYEECLALLQNMKTGKSANSYYSDISIERAHSTESGHSIDRLSLTINPEHPTMQMPKQQKVMEKMFPGGQLIYEMSQKNDRIYMASAGDLDIILTAQNRPSPIKFNEKTRMAGMMNIISFMQMSAGMSGTEAEFDFSQIDAEGTQLKFSLETSDHLTIKTLIPLKLVKVFHDLEMSAQP
jgi:hypothetical protein